MPILFYLKKACVPVAKLLGEAINLTLVCFLPFVLIALFGVITKVSFYAEDRELWRALLTAVFMPGVLCIALGVVERILVGFLYDSDLPRIFSVKRAKRKSKIIKILSYTLGALLWIASFVSHAEWGGDSRQFTGDRWQVYASASSAISTVIFGCAMFFLDLTCMYIVKHSPNDLQSTTEQ